MAQMSPAVKALDKRRTGIPRPSPLKRLIDGSIETLTNYRMNITEATVAYCISTWFLIILFVLVLLVLLSFYSLATPKLLRYFFFLLRFPLFPLSFPVSGYTFYFNKIKSLWEQQIIAHERKRKRKKRRNKLEFFLSTITINLNLTKQSKFNDHWNKCIIHTSTMFGARKLNDVLI